MVTKHQHQRAATRQVEQLFDDAPAGGVRSMWSPNVTMVSPGPRPACGRILPPRSPSTPPGWRPSRPPASPGRRRIVPEALRLVPRSFHLPGSARAAAEWAGGAGFPHNAGSPQTLRRPLQLPLQCPQILRQLLRIEFVRRGVPRPALTAEAGF